MTSSAQSLSSNRLTAASDPAAVKISGENKKWHKVTLTLDGPVSSESASPNPFTDYRFNVIFKHADSGLTYTVPGYFAADGNAGESGASEGNQWRAHLSPDHTGTWTYAISFRSGSNVAVNLNGAAGSAVSPYDGMTGSFEIAESDKSADDFRTKGRLTYDGSRYLKYADTGAAFIKTGADSPENFMNCTDFDNTYSHGGNNLRDWSNHERDWKDGDPTWKDGKGKGIIGAINYLASEEQNAFSFLTYNAGGDSKDVWPFVRHDNPLVYDCSKLDQWEIVFAHGQNKGMYLHFKMQERENDSSGDSYALDNGAMGVERKLYFRELVARFSHHLALNWNMGEENSQTTAQQKAMFQYMEAIDPYHHNRVIHTWPGEWEKVYRPLLGDHSEQLGVSLQCEYKDVHKKTLQWLNESAAAGKQWVVANDEQGGSMVANPPDSQANNSPSQKDTRHHVVWGNLMSGGAGVEIYFGYNHPDNDLNCNNFRSRDQLWDYCRFAKQFFNKHLMFSEMKNMDSLIGNSSNNDDKFCFGKADSKYAIYLPNGGSTTINLSGASGLFKVWWFDSRNGGELQTGSVSQISGGSTVSVGNPPNHSSDDWAVLICRDGKENEGEGAKGMFPSVFAGYDQTVSVPASTATLNGSASDSDGTIVSYKWTQISGPGTAVLSNSKKVTAKLSGLVEGSYTFMLKATDNDGKTGVDTVVVHVIDDRYPKFTVSDLPNGEVNKTYRETVAVTSGQAPYTWSVASGTLPHGLVLNTANGCISGTPTINRSYTFSIKVADVDGDAARREFTLVIDKESFEETRSFSVVQDAYLEGTTLNNNTYLKIESGRRVGYLQFDISGITENVTSARLRLKCQGDSGNGTLHFYRGSHNNWTETTLKDSGKPAAGDAVGSVSGSYSDGSVYEVEVKDLLNGHGNGTYSLVAKMENGGNDVWFSSKEGGAAPVLSVTYNKAIEEEDLKPAIATDSLPNGEVNIAYNETVSVTSGDAPYTWSIVSGSLPDGLSLDASTGRIQGVPAGDGSSVFTIQVADSDQDADQKEYTLVIDKPEIAAGGTKSFDAVQDAYIEGASAKNNQYLKIESGRRVGYLKFNVSGITKNVNSAKLSLKCQGDSGSGTIRFYRGSRNDWTETTLTAAGKPAAGTELASLSGSFNQNTTYEVDVKEMVSGSGDGTYTLVVKMDSGGNDAWFSSKEGSAAPQLTITYDGDSGVVMTAEALTYSRFSSQYGLTGGQLSDDDGDGQPNLLEYATGGDPTDAAVQGVRPKLQFDADGYARYIMYLRKTDVPDELKYTIECCSDLTSNAWHPLSVDEVVTQGDSAGMEEVQQRFKTGEGTSANCYFRLKVWLSEE